jgi:hypothetical protein
MSNFGLAQVDEFVFGPRYKPELQVLVLEDSHARPIFSEFFKRNSPAKEVIGDHVKLTSLHKEIHKRIKYEQPRRKVGGYINGLMNAAALTDTGFSFNLGGLLAQQTPCAAPITLPSLIIIHEDEITAEQLSAFFSLFKQVEPQHCPAFVFISEKRLGEAASALAACGSDIDVLTLTPGGVHELGLKAEGTDSLHDFLRLFLAEADGSCMASSSGGFDFVGEDRGQLLELAVDMLRIQSLFRQGRKFDSKAQIQVLERKIEALRGATSDAALSKEYLYMRALLDLWYVFVTEESRDKIQNAISIADYLGDDILLAHALKQIDMLHGYGSLTRQHLMHAKNVFLSNAETEHALFVDNNAIVNDFYIGGDCSGAASRMSDFILEFCPHIRRSTTFHSNAGIANLIVGQEHQSLPYFQRAIDGSGPPVNKLTSEINLMIARFVSGEALDPSEAERFLRRLDRSNVPGGFDYHQTTMLANLWKMFEGHRSTRRAIVEQLRQKAFMRYDDFLDSPERLLRYVISSYGKVEGEPTQDPPGHIGAFFDHHGLWLSAHVFYR